MKLFLASAFDQTATLLGPKLQKDLKGKKVIFIANPADSYEGDKWWVKIDRDAFIKLGCDIVEVDFRVISIEEFKKCLEESDIIHICGGSVFYTMLLLREKGFDKLITEFVRGNKIIYSGTSAGSMIVSVDLSLDALDPDEKKFIDKTKDYSGFGLVDFLIMPHANNEDFADGNAKTIKQLPKYSKSVIFLYDNQVVWVDDNKLEILSRI